MKKEEALKAVESLKATSEEKSKRAGRVDHDYAAMSLQNIRTSATKK